MTIRGWIGLGLLGYGFLVLIGLTAHESPWAGAASLGLGALLCWRAARSTSTRDHRTGQSAQAASGVRPNEVPDEGSGPGADTSEPPTAAAQESTAAAKPAPSVAAGFSRSARPAIVASLGAICVVGVLGYNAWQRSGLSLPEWAILVYGGLLLAASMHLRLPVGRTDVGMLVAWSFPLVLAPLAMFASNAAFTDESTAVAASPLVHALVVQPTAVSMGWLGTPVGLEGNNMVLTTPRGGLVLGVGLVCAGLYPMVLFGSLLGLHAWQNGLSRRTFAKHLALGVGALWLLNIVRLLILAHVGIRWGGATLQTAHAHMGWVLFAAFMVAYWSIAKPSSRDPGTSSKTLAGGEES